MFSKHRLHRIHHTPASYSRQATGENVIPILSKMNADFPPFYVHLEMRSTRPPPGVFYVNKVINSRRRAKVIIHNHKPKELHSLRYLTTKIPNTWTCSP
ncbi:uncharacterized protein H6S33_010953 [Morchella sextelata]|uniref:uncharacterized protein n=1 Tax=Morchella sextelata TaxID=1174677 RepID=UPI001D0515F0|nr:uncharacterized protein H6S33_010953 [Morchella sextelata]KAH0611688.1 hypothetical protein H6S33_010953 [Morchella sextelata]